MKTLILLAFTFASVCAFAQVESKSLVSKYCSSKGSEIKVIQGLGYVVKKNGYDHTLTNDNASTGILGAADLHQVSELLSQQKQLGSDKVVAGKSASFFSHGTIEGVFSFTEIEMASGNNVALIKDGNGSVIVAGKLGNCK